MDDAGDHVLLAELVPRLVADDQRLAVLKLEPCGNPLRVDLLRDPGHERADVGAADDDGQVEVVAVRRAVCPPDGALDVRGRDVAGLELVGDVVDDDRERLLEPQLDGARRRRGVEAADPDAGDADAARQVRARLHAKLRDRGRGDSRRRNREAEDRKRDGETPPHWRLPSVARVSNTIRGLSETIASTPSSTSRATSAGSFAVQATTAAPRACAATTARRETRARCSASTVARAARSSSGTRSGNTARSAPAPAAATKSGQPRPAAPSRSRG